MDSSNSASASEEARFAVITNDDRTGIIWIVSVLCLVYTFMIFLIRVEARRKNFGSDDALSFIATALAVVQYVLVFFANKSGLGKSYNTIDASDAVTIGRYVLASQAMTLLSLGFTKCSVISLCRRLFTAHTTGHRIVCDIALSVCALWSLASISAVSIGCSPLQSLGYSTDFCPSLVSRWTGIGIVDALTEIAIVLMAFDSLWPLHMSLSHKLQALATFLLRLVLVIFTALHISTLREATSNSNAGIALTKPVVYLQIELLYALFSASIPALNRWLRNFDTSMGSAWTTSPQYSVNNSKTDGSGRSGSQSFPLPEKEKRRVSVLAKELSKRPSEYVKSGEFVPTGPRYTVTSGAHESSQDVNTWIRPGTPSTEDEGMVIRKDVQWQVQYEQDGITPRNSC